MASPQLRRIAAGDYETPDGQFRIVKLVGVYPPAWDVIEAPFTRHEETLFGGCASKRDAVLFLADYLSERGQ